MCNDELLSAVLPVCGDLLSEVYLAGVKQRSVAQSLDYELKKVAWSTEAETRATSESCDRPLGIISGRFIYFFLVVLVASFAPVFFSVFFTPHPGFPQVMTAPPFTVLFTSEDRLFPIECQ